MRERIFGVLLIIISLYGFLANLLQLQTDGMGFFGITLGPLLVSGILMFSGAIVFGKQEDDATTWEIMRGAIFGVFVVIASLFGIISLWNQMNIIMGITLSMETTFGLIMSFQLFRFQQESRTP